MEMHFADIISRAADKSNHLPGILKLAVIIGTRWNTVRMRISLCWNI